MAARRLLTLLSFLVTAARAVADGDAGCDEGWTRSGSRCFKFFEERKTWTDAEKSCHTLGANLPSIHSEAENTFIVDLIVRATGRNTQTWLGGTDAVEEGKWLWCDGSDWDFTPRPSSGQQPDNTGGNENWDATLWDYVPNSQSLVYICAKDAGQTSPQPAPAGQTSPQPAPAGQTSPQPAPEPKVSLTLEGFVCHCTPQTK